MLTVAPFLLLGIGQVKKAPLFIPYRNARFGYAVEIPASLVLKREADNGDGRSYLSKDARTELLVYGSHTLLDDKGDVGDSMAGGYRRWTRQSQREGAVPRFAKFGSGAFSVSWREGRRILYVRTIRLSEGFATVEITYPFDRKPAMDAAIARTMSSLRALRRS